ncbi:MAG: NAD-dependent epimerase/dehydratase family protein [Pseudomonadota bacterium]
MSRPILITGGNGNLGRLVAARFAANGTRVVRLDLPGSNAATSSDRERIVFADVTDTAQLDAIIAEIKPAAICHLASLLSSSSEADLARAWEINAGASFTLMQAAVAHEVRQVFFASTIASYGPQTAEPMPEDAAQWPENFYGVTKVAVERMGNYFATRHELDFRCLRFPMVLSPFAPAGAATAYPSLAFNAAARGENFTFPVAPDVGMSSLFLEDVVASIVAIMNADRTRLTRPAYNLHGFYVSAGAVANALTKRYPGFTPTFTSDAAVTALIKGWPDVQDDSAARTDWGWEPAFDFAASIARMHEIVSAPAID